MKPQRLLFIHAGGGKTGSSALQSALGEAASQLTEHGVIYANAPATQSRYGITSGNGVALYDLIASPRWNVEGADLLESYLGSQEIGICSSEFLGSMSAGNWRKLLETAAHCGIEVRVVFFVRPAGSYLAACYNQDVKRGGVYVSLEEYLPDASWHHLDALITLDAAIPSAALCVLNYDVCRFDITGAFTSAFPELAPIAKILRAGTNPTVNRSLDATEIAIVRRVNQQLGSKAGQSLSDHLIYAIPEKQGGIGLDETQAEIVRIKYADGSSWINERFLGDTSEPLNLGSGMSATDSSSPNDEAQTLVLALDWAIGRLASQSDNGTEIIRQALLTIDWQNANLADIPSDFDPFAYLIFNPDVVSAKIPPFLHFHLSGKREHRTYHWPQPSSAQHDAPIAGVITALHEEGRLESIAEPLSRLRYHYKIEALLHAFAERERKYLDEICRLGERRGFDRAEIRQELSKLSLAVGDNLISNREQNAITINTALNEFRTSLSQARSQTAEFFLEISSRNADAMVELKETTVATYATIARELEALRTEQAHLNQQLIDREAELKLQTDTISRYRQAGLLSSIWWAIRRSIRP